VRDTIGPVAASDPGLERLVTALSSLVDERVPAASVSAYAEVVRRYLVESTGIREEIVPPARPSLARGATLFRENCTGCHGATGAGDGADVARLGITPANFTDRDFMRGETPRDAFNVITLGRQKSGMPSWGDALSPQQIWDLVGYVWSISHSPDVTSRGQRIYAARCAGCHGTQGDPSDSRAAPLERPARSLSALLEGAERSDADVFAVVSAGVPNTAMPAFASLLDEDERWAVASYVRTLSLEGPAGSGGGSLEPDRAAELMRVREVVDAALVAHDRGDRSADVLATNAYMRFEPLERFIAERDGNAVEAIEGNFVAFRTALRDPTQGDADAMGRQLRTQLDGAAHLLETTRAPASARAYPARLELALCVAAIALLGLAYLVRGHLQRPVASERAANSRRFP
jgi:mono/diheme cytochrome c family protein